MVVEPPIIPDRFGPYRVTSVVARGGMGIVYRAIHDINGELVALKTVTHHREFDLVGLRREIHALQRVYHPGVVRVVDSGVCDGIPWYAMPLLAGDTLASMIPSRRPSVELVLTLGRRLAATLAFVHGEGIVHRDLTPANIFVVDGEHPKILDFGLFRRFAGDEGRESIEDPVGLSGGTVGYMSPEQSRGELSDARADLYALGVILHELLTGRRPSQIGAAYPGDVPSAIQAMITKLLARDPAARFGHATELIPILAAHGARAASWEREIVPRGYLYRPGLVGRQAALATIDERLARALDRKGGCVLIAGESGIGKTYLAMHAASAAASYGVEVLASSCGAAVGADTPPLHPFRAVLQAVADACVGTPGLAPRLLGNHGHVLAAIEPRLSSLPHVKRAGAIDDGGAATGELVEKRMFAALTAMLDAYAAISPCVLVLDDLQWADELTLRFLSTLPDEWFDGRGLLIVATYRVDQDRVGVRELEARPWTLRVELARLGESEVRALVCDMLALPEPDPAWIAALTRASGGNPFFVAEYLRSAIADGSLARDALGRWQLDPREGSGLPDPGRGSSPPPRIEAIIARRLSALGVHARTLLAALVVLDRDADTELATSLASLGEVEALEAVRELVARQVVDARDTTLNVLHDALRETAYRALPRDERRRLHRHAASLLEARYGDTQDPGSESPVRYASLARHYAEGSDAGRAVHYLALAGERALSTNANRDAARHFGDALALANEAAVDSVTRARFLRRLAEASTGLGDLQESERHLFRALEVLGEARPTGRGAVVSLPRDLAIQLLHRALPRGVVRGGHERARLEEAARTFAILAERAYFGYDAITMVAASVRAMNRAERAALPLARPYAMLGITAGLGKLRGVADRYFSLAREASRVDRAGEAFAILAEAAFQTGEARFELSRPLVERVIEVATTMGDSRGLGFGETMLGHEQFYRGEFRSSAATYRRIEERARREENEQLVAWGLYAGARALVPMGELELAVEMLREAEKRLATRADAPSQLICAGLLSLAELRRGARDAALAALERCESLVRTIPPTVFSLVSGYVAAADVRLSLARRARDAATMRALDAAVSHLERFAFAIPLGGPAAQRLRAEVLLLSGRRPAAARKLERAVSLAEKTGMRHEQALAHAALGRALGSDTGAHHRARAAAMLGDLACPIEPLA